MNRLITILLTLWLASCADSGTAPDEPDWRIEFTGSHQGIQTYDFDQNGNATFEILLKSGSTSLMIRVFGSMNDSIDQRRPLMRGPDTVGMYAGRLDNSSGIYVIYPDGSGYWFTEKIR